MLRWFLKHQPSDRLWEWYIRRRSIKALAKHKHKETKQQTFQYDTATPKREIALPMRGVVKGEQIEFLRGDRDLPDCKRAYCKATAQSTKPKNLDYKYNYKNCYTSKYLEPILPKNEYA